MPACEVHDARGRCCHGRKGMAGKEGGHGGKGGKRCAAAAGGPGRIEAAAAEPTTRPRRAALAPHPRSRTPLLHPAHPLYNTHSPTSTRTPPSPNTRAAPPPCRTMKDTQTGQFGLQRLSWCFGIPPPPSDTLEFPSPLSPSRTPCTVHPHGMVIGVEGGGCSSSQVLNRQPAFCGSFATGAGHHKHAAVSCFPFSDACGVYIHSPTHICMHSRRFHQDSVLAVATPLPLGARNTHSPPRGHRHRPAALCGCRTSHFLSASSCARLTPGASKRSIIPAPLSLPRRRQRRVATLGVQAGMEGAKGPAGDGQALLMATMREENALLREQLQRMQARLSQLEAAAAGSAGVREPAPDSQQRENGAAAASANDGFPCADGACGPASNRAATQQEGAVTGGEHARGDCDDDAAVGGARREPGQASSTTAFVCGHGLTKGQAERYSRHLLLPAFGVAGQERVCRGSVLIIGCGGLGSPAAMYLAAAGVGRCRWTCWAGHDWVGLASSIGGLRRRGGGRTGWGREEEGGGVERGGRLRLASLRARTLPPARGPSREGGSCEGGLLGRGQGEGAGGTGHWGLPALRTSAQCLCHAALNASVLEHRVAHSPACTHRRCGPSYREGPDRDRRHLPPCNALYRRPAGAGGS